MNLLVDAHAHLYFFDNPKEVVERAAKAGVSAIINNGVDPESNRKVLELEHPVVKKAIGLHPKECSSINHEKIDEELRFIAKNKDNIVAVGEIGLDYMKVDDKEKQEDIFTKSLKVAKSINKPVIVHSRKAEHDVVALLEEAEINKVVMHCFDGSTDLVKRCIANGWFFTVPTNIVKSKNMKRLARLVPLKQILTETDAPFLSPFSDKKNEPAFVVESAKQIANIKGLAVEELVNIVYNNYQRIFL